MALASTTGPSLLTSRGITRQSWDRPLGARDDSVSSATNSSSAIPLSASSLHKAKGRSPTVVLSTRSGADFESWRCRASFAMILGLRFACPGYACYIYSFIMNLLLPDVTMKITSSGSSGHDLPLSAASRSPLRKRHALFWAGLILAAVSQNAMAAYDAGAGQLLMYIVAGGLVVVGLIFAGMGALIGTTAKKPRSTDPHDEHDKHGDSSTGVNPHDEHEDSSAASGAANGVVVFLLLLLALCVSVYVSAMIDEKNRKARANANAAERKVAVENTELILLQRCKEEEKLVINKTVAPGSSIFVNLFPENDAPTAANVSTVVPTDAMRKYRELFFMKDDEQYRKPVSWIKDANRPQSIAKLMQTDLVDSRNRYKKTGEKAYKRLATKQRWEKDGLSDIAIAYTEKYRDDLKFRNWPDGEFKEEIPIDQPGAQYMLTVEDISTIEDRNDWLARGRIRLRDTSIDTSTMEVAAEYLGFQSLLTGAVCSSVRKAPILSRRDERRDMLTFFFGAVLHSSDSAPAAAR
jgi:Na+-transporting methylmalonyl-CoA/oxaloacetate decarboxylase gamma subunit